MFEVLSASHPAMRIGAPRYLLSAGIHSALLAGAVALTQPTAATTPAHPSERDILFVAPQPMRTPPPAPRHEPAGQTGPALPVVPSTIDAPELAAPVLSTSLPSLADVLDGVGVEPNPGQAGTAHSPGAAVPLGTEPLTAAAVDEPVAVLKQPTPRYPAALAQAGITGRVELEYVVDTTGRAEPGSVRALATTHPAFEAAARSSVLASRYKPARSGGRMVRQLVRQSLSFRSAE